MHDHSSLYRKDRNYLSLVYHNYCLTSYTELGGLLNLEIMIWLNGLSISRLPRGTELICQILYGRRVGLESQQDWYFPPLSSFPEQSRRLAGASYWRTID